MTFRLQPTPKPCLSPGAVIRPAEDACRMPSQVAECAPIIVPMLPVAPACTADPRVTGAVPVTEPIWARPPECQIALLLYPDTMATVSPTRPARRRQPRLCRAPTWMVVGAIGAQIAWTAGAAVRGTTSLSKCPRRSGPPPIGDGRGGGGADPGRAGDYRRPRPRAAWFT